MIAKVLINTTVKTLNKVYDYLVPQDLEALVEVGKRVEVSFGKSRGVNEEGIIVKLEEGNEENIPYKLKPIVQVLDEISYINDKKLKLAKYMSKIYFCNVYDALKLMLPPGTRSKNSSKNLNTKQETAIRLIKSQEEIEQDIENEILTSGKHMMLLRFLLENELVYVNDVIEGLGISRSIMNTVAKNGYIELYKLDPPKDLMADYQVSQTTAQIPTPEQKVAIDQMGSFLYDEKYCKCLLFGVTGSGKTEVYLQLIEKVLMQGKRAIVLVPEISLTYQTVNRFVARFGNTIAVLHSKMTVAQRKEEYKRIKQGKVDIVIGARSAIFSPVEELGLVIIDEEHDSSYYSQTTPKYSTKEIASFLCKQNDALLVLGSATPEITTYYQAKNDQIHLFELKSRPGSATLPAIELIDMKQEKVLGNRGVISHQLKEELSKNIENHEQTMLFLNRRGYSSYFTCHDCSYIFKCPNCDVAMTYHKNNHLLLCHYCSHVEKNISVCPVCGSQNISQSSIGTQRLEEELKSMFPTISVIRMDADTTVARDAHQKILDEFKNKKAEVLLGTQMISKGHDIANVTLVGILGVDAMLAMNDYSAAEKAFSNISQVAGRAGRATLPGRVLIQTNDVDHYILEAVVHHSYEEFYEKEIAFRQTFGYPPFQDIILFELVCKEFALAKSEAQRLYDILSHQTEDIYKVFSPQSPLIQKINNKYRVNVLIKTKITKEFYTKIDEKIALFRQHQKNNVHLVITKNPTMIH